MKLRYGVGTIVESRGSFAEVIEVGIVLPERKSVYSKIKWLDKWGHEQLVISNSLSQGAFSNPYAPMVYGVGFLGVGNYENKTHRKHYTVWRSLLNRVYDLTAKEKSLFRPYVDCLTVEEWHCFQSFAAWCETQVGFSVSGYELDKDLLVRGNKLYSPETCCFIPARINTLIVRSSSSPNGYWHTKDKRWTFSYRELSGKKVANSFNDPSKGKLWYKENKERVIKEAAELYKNQIDPRAYEALLSWEISIDN